MKKEEYIYKDLEITMSTKIMADVMYAGIITKAAFPILWSLDAPSYTRKQSSRFGATVKVHIHPSKIQQFEELVGLKLKTPPQITIN